MTCGGRVKDHHREVHTPHQSTTDHGISQKGKTFEDRPSTGSKEEYSAPLCCPTSVTNSELN